MKLVSDNPEPRVAPEQALNRVREPFRALTANLIRIVRGAGSPFDFFEDLVRFRMACESYEKAIGHGLTGQDLRVCLEIDNDPKPSWSDERYERECATERIIEGALRITAARLLDQQLQIAAGERDFFSALRDYARAVEDERKARMAEIPTFERTRSKPKGTRGKPKTKGK